MNQKKSFLIILDGWGLGKVPKVDAIQQANTPFVDGLFSNYPSATLTTFGTKVGLPEGQMGNSEVGHLNIGAGRIVFQELARINNEIETGKLAQNQTLINAIDYAQSRGKRVHVLGLLSDGGVHCHINHIKAITDILNKHMVPSSVHAFLDGRDTAPNNGIKYLNDLQDHINGSTVRLSTIVGRYYAMDRDNRWERIKVAYDLLVHNHGLKTDDFNLTVKDYYKESITDEFMKPIVVNADRIEQGDVVLFVNFRTDRPRELTSVLSQKDFPDHDMKKLDLHFVSMTEYDKSFENINIMFVKDNIQNTIGEVIAKKGKSQIRIAETEKYPHVTFFLNGGQEALFENEHRILIPSPKVATYDLQPEMSAPELTEKIIAAIKQNPADFICLNFANTDMVGHTGIMSAAIRAAETVDNCMSKIIPLALDNDYGIVIIADHGNADIMINPDGSPHTAHTTNLVPVLVLDKNKEVKSVANGILADIAPTILDLMGIEQPTEMTGKSLISF